MSLDIAKPNFHAGRVIISAQADKIDEVVARLEAQERLIETLTAALEETRPLVVEVLDLDKKAWGIACPEYEALLRTIDTALAQAKEG